MVSAYGNTDVAKSPHPPQASGTLPGKLRGIAPWLARERSHTMQLPTVLRKPYYRSHGVTVADVTQASWEKSWYSNLNGSCVEIGRVVPDRIGVRDTKDSGSGPILFFTDAEWGAFVAAIKSGQFDNL